MEKTIATVQLRGVAVIAFIAVVVAIMVFTWSTVPESGMGVVVGGGQGTYVIDVNDEEVEMSSSQELSPGYQVSYDSETRMFGLSREYWVVAWVPELPEGLLPTE